MKIPIKNFCEHLNTTHEDVEADQAPDSFHVEYYTVEICDDCGEQIIDGESELQIETHAAQLPVRRLNYAR